jgi:hypothetical protein
LRELIGQCAENCHSLVRDDLRLVERFLVVIEVRSTGEL